MHVSTEKTKLLQKHREDLVSKQPDFLVTSAIKVSEMNTTSVMIHNSPQDESITSEATNKIEMPILKENDNQQLDPKVGK